MSRVAVFRHDLLPLSETFIRTQVESLRNWRPVLVGRRLVADGLSLDSVARHIIPNADSAGGRLSERLAFWSNRPVPRFVRAFESLDVALVHAHFGTDATDIWPSVAAAGLPMVVTLHGYDINIRREWWEAGHGGLRRRMYPRRLLEMARASSARFIAVSEAVRERAVEYGIPEEKIEVAYIGVDTARFAPAGLPLAQRRKRILFVGRMVEKKAPLLMVETFAEVRKAIPDAELVMVGSGPLLASARQMADSLCLPVEFPGDLGPDEVLAQIHQARAFCLPSVTARNGDAEGLPIVVLEAMASGLPVVTSANGAVTDAITGSQFGARCREWDKSSLSSALVGYLLDASTAAAIAASARDLVLEKFDVSRNSEVLESIYAGPKTQR